MVLDPVYHSLNQQKTPQYFKCDKLLSAIFSIGFHNILDSNNVLYLSFKFMTDSLLTFEEMEKVL